jgi:hypothetical protein
VVNNPRDSLVEGLKVNASEMVVHHADKKDAPKPAAVAIEKPKS